ncbi:MAG: glycosyltransferase family 1 protein [Micrococcales bacterium]|nr:glycosyltransferase family 1 protein [Micrococcales bacterium]
MPKSKSILFLNPDYHCSFFLKDELRRRGWRADILMQSWYPRQLLFRDDVIQEKLRYGIHLGWSNWLRFFAVMVLRTIRIVRYKYVIHYGSLNKEISESGRSSRVFLMLLKAWYRLVRITGTHFVFIPSGCRDHVSKEEWLKIDGGRVCSNCGYEPRCSDNVNRVNFQLVRRFSSASLPGDGQKTVEFEETRIRYKSFDLSLYAPNLPIPPKFVWPADSTIKVLHSHALIGRGSGGKNIKGTEYVIQAVERLKSEEIDVSLVNLSGVASRDMRFHQVQADVIVDQLIYGGYGSTTLEAMALGKPVICYIRPSWKTYLTSLYPEWASCPIISATPETVYLELRKLVVDDQYRHQVGEESRRFAEKFLDVRKNVVEFEHLLLSLDDSR